MATRALSEGAGANLELHTQPPPNGASRATESTCSGCLGRAAAERGVQAPHLYACFPVCCQNQTDLKYGNEMPLMATVVNRLKSGIDPLTNPFAENPPPGLTSTVFISCSHRSAGKTKCGKNLTRLSHTITSGAEISRPTQPLRNVVC